jgi:hypothetical protein
VARGSVQFQAEVKGRFSNRTRPEEVEYSGFAGADGRMKLEKQ